MDRETVASSSLVSVGYDGQAETLEIEFKGNAVYQYYNVPQAVYDALMASDSKGKFFIANIKNAFACSRV